MSRNVSVPRIKISHQVIVKAPGLLPMLYNVRELAEELGMPERTLRDWLLRGAPHNWDARRHLWVNGEEFTGWVKAQHSQRKRTKLADGQAYCLHCNQVVQLSAIEKRPIKGKLVHFKGHCPNCGAVINRGGRLD